MEREQGSFKARTPFLKQQRRPLPHTHAAPDFASTSVSTNCSSSVPGSLRSFVVMEGLRLRVTVLPKGNLISQTRGQKGVMNGRRLASPFLPPLQLKALTSMGPELSLCNQGPF